MMKGIVRLGLILAAFSIVACVALAVVYSVTAEQIEMQTTKQLQESLKGLFPAAETFDDITATVTSPNPDVKFDAVYAAKAGGAVIGSAVKARGPSYGGDASVLVGVTSDKKIAGVRVLDIKDTPGLGANAVSPTYFVDKSSKTTFPGQFTGKLLTDGFEVKKDVVAITASTITSRALTKLIKTAGDAASAWLATAAAENAAPAGSAMMSAIAPAGNAAAAAPAASAGGK